MWEWIQSSPVTLRQKPAYLPKCRTIPFKLGCATIFTWWLVTAANAVCLLFTLEMHRCWVDVTFFHVVEVLEVGHTFFQVTHDPVSSCFPNQAFTEWQGCLVQWLPSGMFPLFFHFAPCVPIINLSIQWDAVPNLHTISPILLCKAVFTCAIWRKCCVSLIKKKKKDCTP